MTATKKTFALDTNVLLSDPNSLFSFEDNDVIVPLVVLEELDRHKSRLDEVGRNARQVNRTLDGMRERGSLFDGVDLPNGGRLRVMSIDRNVLADAPIEFREPKVDNLIVAFMLSLEKLAKTSVCRFSTPIILVTKDVNVRVKCDALGLQCQDYLKMRVADDVQSLYTGVSVVEVVEDRVDQFFRDGTVELTSDELCGKRMYPNQVVILKNVNGGQTVKSAITRCAEPVTGKLVPITKVDHVFGLKPRNKEQTFALDLLLNDDIKLVTLCGHAGCGKTLLAIAAGLEQLRAVSPKNGKYDKLVVTRPVHPMGKDIGFLPGDINEKMAPWIAPIRDNFSFLMDNNRGRDTTRRQLSDKFQQDNEYLQLLQAKGLIEIEAITFIRGRSIPNAYIVVDEAQNLSPHELKTIITRVGENTKLICTGDVTQIDNVHVDIFTNGLTYAVEKFKQYPIAGHVTLLKGERSALASLASQVL